MHSLAAGVSYLDLDFLQTPRVIATGVLHASSGVALIDPGPASTLPTLRARLADAGIGLGDVTAVLLTHIHLDHAGVTGSLLREAVVTPGWLSDETFLAGYGAAQAVPGPLFSFAAFIGASMRQPSPGLAGAITALAKPWSVSTPLMTGVSRPM